MLRALEEPDTLDPLGFGGVRDAFSEILAPGTSTIQTRLRYFLFLPWIFRGLEEERVPPARFAEHLRDREARLIDCLRHLGPSHGVIGFSAGRDLKRMPSEVYWGGLWRWRIRKLDLSLSEYSKWAATLAGHRVDRDDDGNSTSKPPAMWAEIPAQPAGFLSQQVDFDLSRPEAEFLVDQIRRRCPGSLLAALCDMPDAAAGADLPWDAATDAIPAGLHEPLRHARCYSELTIGPQLVYNVLLARDARAKLIWETDDFEDSARAELEAWAVLVSARHDELSRWVDDLESLWAFIEPVETPTERTRAFIELVARRAVDRPKAFGDDPVVAQAIRSREAVLKGKRARLTNRSALESWRRQPFGNQFSYRWPTVRGYMNDIARALSEDG